MQDECVCGCFCNNNVDILEGIYMTDNYTSSLNEIIDEIAKVMAAQSGNHKANYRSPHYQRKAKAVYETTITAMGDASGRDCPDCGLTMRGGQHVCPSPESKDTLNRITSEELDEYTRLSRTDQWWQELVGSDVRRLIGEVRYWKEQAFRPLGDNHHNAKLCPHCNQGSEIPDTTEIEILEDEVIIAGRSYVPKQEQGEISDANIKAIKYKIAAVIYERIKMKRPNLPPGNGEAMAYANAALDIVKSYLRYPVRELSKEDVKNHKFDTSDYRLIGIHPARERELRMAYLVHAVPRLLVNSLPCLSFCISKVTISKATP